MNFITTHWVDILAIYGALIALLTVIVKATPTPTDDAVLAKVEGFIAKFIPTRPE